MIRINLLPVRQTQKRQSVQQQLLIAVGVLILSVLGSIIWTAAVSSTAEQKRQAVRAKENELKKLDKIIGEVNQFTDKKKELEEKLKVIEDLRRGKTGPVKALDDLASEIPNRVWLTEIEESNGAVTIQGQALDAEDVSAFMKALQRSKYFSGVNLQNLDADDEVDRGVKLQAFTINCVINYSA
jgi:type IV pilus assembly protein PilN